MITGALLLYSAYHCSCKPGLFVSTAASFGKWMQQNYIIFRSIYCCSFHCKAKCCSPHWCMVDTAKIARLSFSASFCVRFSLCLCFENELRRKWPSTYNHCHFFFTKKKFNLASYKWDETACIRYVYTIDRTFWMITVGAKRKLTFCLWQTFSNVVCSR